MDWRDFMRGFFGGRSSNGGPRVREDNWPPPPPIEEFNEDSNPSGQRGAENEFWGRSRPRRPEDEGFEDFGNRFVFGDMFSLMGEMFQEMERNMRDMESFFGGGGFEGHPRMIPFPNAPPAIEGITPNPNPKSPPPSNDDNIRDLVLKEPDTPSCQQDCQDRHYIPSPNNPKEKVDRDLDDLVQQSKIDLSDLPVPRNEESAPLSITPFNFFGGDGQGSFKKTYQTFSFKNGRWEGEVIKEDKNGKEVTRFYQDDKGQRHETTEYFPRGGENSVQPKKPALEDSPRNSHSSSLFPVFERFFKPKI